MSEPFFYAKIVNDSIETKGMDSCALGHKVDHTPGQKPDGIYVNWLWDGKRLTVENDRYGMHPLYYYCGDNEICISPSIEQILTHGIPRDLDYSALSVFLRIGFFIDNDTPFKHIRALPPNATFVWEGGALTVSGKFECGQKTEGLTYEQALDRYINLFHQAIERRLPADGNFSVPVSGGRDSRHILFELCKLGYKPEFCLTARNFPPQNDEDIRIAKLITEELGLKHIIIEQDKTYFQTEMMRNIETNFCSDELHESFVVNDYLFDKVHTIYDGLAGAIVSAGFFVNELKDQLLKAGEYKRFAQQVILGWGKNCFPESVMQELLHSADYEKLSRKHAIERIAKEATKYQNTPNPGMQFIFWNRTRREITLSPYRLYRKIKTVYSPYLDHDVYDFLSSLDASYFYDRNFHTKAIHRAFPQYAHIPFEDKKLPGQDPVPFRKKFVWDLLLYILREQKTFRRTVRAKYVLPRLTRYLLKNDNWWISPNLIFYLIHLNKTAQLNGNGFKQQVVAK